MPNTTTVRRFGMQLRAEVDGNRMVGHASVFDQLADVGTYWERIERGAFDNVLADPATDVRAFINHNHNLLLGRQSSGTLRLRTDDQGLAFDLDLPDTSYAQDLRELAARGDMDGASFGFIPAEDKLSGRAPDGRQIRSYTDLARLVDISVVTFPAYSGADAALRFVTFGPATAAATYRKKLVRARARRTVQKGTTNGR